jgi:hypothetical protein
MRRNRRHRAARHWASLVLSLPGAACGAGWQTVSQPWPESVAPRQQVEVWSDHRATRLHGVVITPDSVSGVPFLAPLSCDSCRVGFPRAQVDSIRVGDPPGGLWASTGLVLLGLLAAALAICLTGSQDCPGFLAGDT